jgi:hypothetical protein
MKMTLATNDESTQITGIEAKIKHLKEKVISKIDQRVRGGEKKTQDEIYDKLFKIDEDKPGEFYELRQALGQENPDPASCLLEIADLVFYAMDYDSDNLLQDIFRLSETYGIQQELAVDACIVKYELRYNKNDKNFEAEKEAVQFLIDELSELTPDNFNYTSASQKLDKIVANQLSYQSGQE